MASQVQSVLPDVTLRLALKGGLSVFPLFQLGQRLRRVGYRFRERGKKLCHHCRWVRLVVIHLAENLQTRISVMVFANTLGGRTKILAAVKD